MKCIDKFCKKCEQSTHQKSRIKCSLCCYVFHFSCAKIPLSQKTGDRTKSWLCQKCCQTTFPFSNVDDRAIFNMSNHKLDNFTLKNTAFKTYSSICNVCKVNLTHVFIFKTESLVCTYTSS